MGPADNLTLGLNLDLMSLSVPKFCDDGSNWADYEPRVERALGVKGLWRHIVGTAIVPEPYAVVAGVLVKFPSHGWECVLTVGPAECIHLTA